jgi:hypothetical protein
MTPERIAELRRDCGDIELEPGWTEMLDEIERLRALARQLSGQLFPPPNEVDGPDAWNVHLEGLLTELLNGDGT